MVFLLTAEAVPVDQLLQGSHPTAVKQGRELFRQGRARVEQSNGASAVVVVSETDRLVFQVRATLGGNGGNFLQLQCGCRNSVGWGLCKHRVAAALALRDHLKANPPAVWRAVLDQALRSPTRQSIAPPSGNVIIFSLQERGQAWALIPYSLSGRLLPPGHNGDIEIITSALERQKLGDQLKPIRSQITPDSYPTMPAVAVAAVNTAVAAGAGAQGGHGPWYTGPRTLATVLAMLPGCIVYGGDEKQPIIGGRLTINTEPATTELELERDPGFIEARFRLAFDGRHITLRPGYTHVLSSEPTWLLADEQVVRLTDGGPPAELMAAHPRVRIPTTEEADFIEHYLVPLSASLPVRGQIIQWETVDGPPAPRLYLGELDGELTAELRFGYGPFELEYDRTLPAEAVQRQEGSAVLYRVRRSPDTEQAAFQQVGSFGLKRSDEDGEFVLRKGTTPLDFLLREVPKLATAGFEIFGEETLTVARVNRSRPSISFKVTTAASSDWFDVEAVIKFGDQMLSLKELKRALRRRERYIKLADGSLGTIPEEWLERYRHLFTFGEERGDYRLRLSSQHLTIIDDALESADNPEVDKAFAERRERLRSFDKLAHHPLPRGFVGTLRPYQKAGYDWLHFLRTYHFGGILADDMGTGKCLTGDSRIYLNGTLQTAASIWERYAGPARPDGEGEWADPTAPLTVNAIDEATGKIVPARVRQLYRQPVREQLRTVCLEDGSSVTITRRHRLLGRDGWTTDLRPGDYICVPSRLVWEGEPVDADLVTLLAWQIAEGCELAKESRLVITQANTATLTKLADHLQRLSERYSFKLNHPSVVYSPDKTPDLRVNSVAYRRFLEAHGYAWGRKSADKAIPDFIMRADDASIRLFLRHYFDAEGSVMKAGRGIEVSSASETLMKQISTLLRRLGIWLRIHVKEKSASNGSGIKRPYQIGLIGGSSARRFATLVGFGNPAKQQALDELCALPCNTNVEGVPASDIVGELVTTTGLPVRHLGMHNTVYLDGSQQFSRASLSRVVAHLDPVVSGASEETYRAAPRSKWTTQTLAAYEQLDRTFVIGERERLVGLLDRAVHYCRIEAVEEVAYDGWVYDLEVETHHNFVAEGILCHNTVQTLALLQSVYEEEPRPAASLIVMPRSLLINWQREAAQFAPGLRVHVHADTGRIREPEQFGEHDIILTTYGVLLRDIDLLKSYRFHYAILDESQAIKNPAAETSRAARVLVSDHRLALTGTPIENTTAELWSQFAFLNPGLLGTLDYFREQFVGPIERRQDEGAAQLLRRIVFPFILRRTKDQVATDLPPRSEELLVVDLDAAQRKLYVKTRDYYRALLLGMIDGQGIDDARMKILEGLLRLRQICNHPRLIDAKFRGTSAKFELLIDTLETLRSEGHKALIFSQFVQMLHLIREGLDTRGVPYAYLDGSTTDRQSEVDRFQSTPNLPFFLISLKAGGVGLNLTAADYVIHVDPWWNPAVEAQATDRAHRIGQTRPVFVYKLIARDTVEEKILKLQEQKRAIAAQVISTEGGVFKALTRDDVEALFS